LTEKEIERLMDAAVGIDMAIGTSPSSRWLIAAACGQ
jgi:hypothetical protein